MPPMTSEEGFTEWFDDGEPPLGTPLHDEDVFKVWSDVQPGDRVRWKTPTFLKRGTLVTKNKRAMVVLFDAHSRPTTIPDAKWYFCEGRLGNLQEHLCIISTPPDPNVKLNGDSRAAWYKTRQEQMGDIDDPITPAQAAAILGTDPKNIRRMIRTGKIRALRNGGRWVLSRKEIER